MKRPVRMSLDIAGAGAGVEEVAVEERVALPLLMSLQLENKAHRYNSHTFEMKKCTIIHFNFEKI